MKYLKHILLCCSFFILLLCLIPAQAQASKYTYNIEKYDVSLRVTPQNTYEITEKLTVNFKTEHHGIYRRIPLENEVGRDDGSRSIIHARVSGIDCGEDDYSTSREGDYLVIQIGDVGIRVGAFLNAIINFLIVAFVLFVTIKAINMLHKKPVEEPKEPTTKKCPYCQSEIAIKAVRCPHCTSKLEGFPEAKL